MKINVHDIHRKKPILLSYVKYMLKSCWLIITTTKRDLSVVIDGFVKVNSIMSSSKRKSSVRNYQERNKDHNTEHHGNSTNP